MNKQDFSITINNYPALDENPFLYVNEQQETSSTTIKNIPDDIDSISDTDQLKQHLDSLSVEYKAEENFGGSNYIKYLQNLLKERIQNITFSNYVSDFFTLHDSNKSKLDDIYDSYFGTLEKRKKTIQFMFESFIPDMVNRNYTTNSERISEKITQYSPLFRFAYISNELANLRQNDTPNNYYAINNAITNENIEDLDKLINQELQDAMNLDEKPYKPVKHLLDIHKAKKNQAKSIFEKRILALIEIHIEYLFFYCILLILSSNNNDFALNASDYENIIQYSDTINNRVLRNTIENTGPDETGIPNVIISTDNELEEEKSGIILTNDSGNHPSADTEFLKVIKTRFATQTILDILQVQHRRLYMDEWSIEYLRSQTQQLGKDINYHQNSINNEKSKVDKESQFLTTMRDKEQNQQPILRRAFVYMIIYILLVALFIGLNIAYIGLFEDNVSLQNIPIVNRVVSSDNGKANILIIANLIIIGVVLLVRFIQTVYRRERRLKPAD